MSNEKRPAHFDIMLGLLKDWACLVNSSDQESVAHVEFIYQMTLRAIREYEGPDWYPEPFGNSSTVKRGLGG